MSTGINGILLSILPAVLFILLRLILKHTNCDSHVETEGVAVFRGARADCLEALDRLTDAGVASWIEDGPEGPAVHVDKIQAEQIPMLLQIPCDAEAKAQPRS